ncbi:MAG: serine hydrolase, partial [Bacteroidota bacterium]
RYHYSNLGATLLAFILEQVSGKTYAQLCQEYIFEPLGLQASTWSLAEVPKNDRASLYLSNALAIPPYQLITYPDGGLLTNIEDFTLYLREILRGVNGESQQLSPESYQEMTSQQLTTQHFPEGKFSKYRGLFWALNAEGDNIYMDGADPGIGTYTILTKKGNMGIVLFMNISSYGNESISQDLRKIRGIIFQYAGKLRK